MGNQQTSPLSEDDKQLIKDMTNFTQEDVDKHSDFFLKAFPDGFMTPEDFVKLSLQTRGGSEELWTRVFKQLDLNGDGRLSVSEYLVAVHLHRRGDPLSKLELTFRLFDDDGNGELSKEEMTMFVNAVFNSTSQSSVLTAEMSHMLSNVEEFGVDAVVESLFQRVGASESIKLDKLKEAAQSDKELMSLFNYSLNTSETRVEILHSLEEKDLRTFEAQVAGHGSTDADKAINLAMLRSNDGKTIWKAYNQTEFEFYSGLKSVPEDAYIHQVVPKFFGRDFIRYQGSTHNYLIQENLLLNMKKPSICDLKMGTQGHGDDADLGKVMQQKVLVSVTTSKTLGFRVCGMRVHQGDNVVKRGKPWGAKLKNRKDMLGALRLYLNDGTQIRYDVVPGILNKLYALLAWFEKQTLFRFYSSSILLMYDADQSSSSEAAPGPSSAASTSSSSSSSSSSSVAAPVPVFDVKMIDFAHAHATTDGRKDESYLTGLRELITELETILSDGPPTFQQFLDSNHVLDSFQPNAKLALQVLSGEALAAKDIGGTSDPYVKIFHNDQLLLKTDYIRRTLNPKWTHKTVTECDASGFNSGTFWFEVWDRNATLKDQSMGIAKVDASQLPFFGKLPVEVHPKHPKSKASGFINVAIYFTK